MSAHHQSCRPIKLLIVDDDRDALVHEEKIFNEKEFHVISASSGEECLKLAYLHHPDIILLDAVLPDFNGVELCRKIKDDSELSSVFVFLISNEPTDNDTLREALKAGADEYILRPTSNEELLARIKKAEEVIRESEKSLRESEEKYRSFMNDAADAIVITDETGLILEANKKALEFFGYSHNELISLSIEILLPSESGGFVTSVMRNLMEARSQRLKDKVIRRKDGNTASADITASLYEYKGAWIIQVLFRDLTAQQMLQRQFIQAQKMEGLGRLAGGIAHDFNNLLTVIDGFSTMVRNSLNPGDPRREDLDDILSATSSAATLTRQLLDFSRKKPMEPMIIDLNELLMNTDRMLRRIIGEDVELIIIPSQEPAFVKADPGAIEQVLVNLAVNARDAMTGGGRLSLVISVVTFTEPSLHLNAALAPGEYVLLTVSDTGQGMTDEVKSHLFELFFTTKEEGKGTGLGLATVYGIVGQHQGAIEVMSEVGKGTVFKIYLHLHKKVEYTDSMDDEDPLLIGGSETVLLVEDDPSIRSFMINLLKKLGYSVLEAVNGEEALKTITSGKENIHLIITDIVMPLMSGKTLMEQIYLLGLDTAVLFVSGYAYDSEDYKSILHRMDFLEKPFTAIQLASKIRQCLSRRISGTCNAITENIKIASKAT